MKNRFFVLATQNPIEQEGTYPLPEAQLDRFIFNLWIDYPTEEEERAIVKATTGAQTHDIKPVLNADQIRTLQQLIRKVPVADHIVEHAVGVGSQNAPPKCRRIPRYRAHAQMGRRAARLSVPHLGRQSACRDQRSLCPSLEDVSFVAKPVLRHRLVTSFNAEAEGITTADLIDQLLAES